MFQYLNGEALVRKSFRERRKLLKEHFKEVEGEFLFAKSAEFSSIDGVQEILEQSVQGKKSHVRQSFSLFPLGSSTVSRLSKASFKIK